MVANLSPTALESLRPAATRVIEIGNGRYTIELPLSATPEQVLPAIAAAGASVVSLNPLRETLEDFFVQRIAEAGAGARDDAAAGGHAGR